MLCLVRGARPFGDQVRARSLHTSSSLPQSLPSLPPRQDKGEGKKRRKQQEKEKKTPVGCRLKGCRQLVIYKPPPKKRKKEIHPPPKKNGWIVRHSARLGVDGLGSDQTASCFSAHAVLFEPCLRVARRLLVQHHGDGQAVPCYYWVICGAVLVCGCGCVYVYQGSMIDCWPSVRGVMDGREGDVRRVPALPRAPGNNRSTSRKHERQTDSSTKDTHPCS